MNRQVGIHRPEETFAFLFRKEEAMLRYLLIFAHLLLPAVVLADRPADGIRSFKKCAGFKEAYSVVSLIHTGERELKSWKK